jgi:phosphoserine phosphatase RsbU/P
LGRRHIARENAQAAKSAATGRNVFRWEAGGPVIGLLPEAHYEEGCFELQPSDLIVLYTDGVSESMDAQDGEWGEESLIACAKTYCGLTACEDLDLLMSGAVGFAAGTPQHDEMTLVVLRVLA